VLEIWDPEILDDCRQARQWQKIYQRSQSRRDTLRRIAEAIEAEDLPLAERLLADPSLEKAELPPQLAGDLGQLRVRQHRAALAKRQAIVNTLLNNERGLFAELFEADLVRQICEQFRHHHPVINQWMESEILPASKIGLAADPDHAITRDEEGNLHLLWTWPQPRISNQCRLVICDKPPAAHMQPDDVRALHAATIDRDQWDPLSGYVVQMTPEWEDKRVFVWAVVDLGLQVFFSTPFEVGLIKPAAKQTQRRWSLFRRLRGEEIQQEGAKSESDPESEQAARPSDETPPDGDAPDSANNASRRPTDR
jgi:hypothetical protein